MKHKTFFAYLVLTALMTGCLKVQKKDEVAKVAQPKPQQGPTVQPKRVITRELRLDDVFVEFEGQPQPDMYDMNLSWPETRDRVRVSVNGQVAFAVHTSERQAEGIKNIQGGTKLSVLIEILDQEYHVITSETRDLDVPKDYIFPKNLRLTNEMRIAAERVFLNGSTIVTENHYLEIRAQKLIVLEKSFIQNYVYDTKAKIGEAGRHGGSIYIEAVKAEGQLDITINSEAGGDGLKGYQSPPCSHNDGIGCHIGAIHCPGGGKGFESSSTR